MQAAPIPHNEEQRVAALRRYGVLDTSPEAEFDDFTQLASHICGTPIALISLVDEHRQWFKSRRGLDAPETPRDWAFCTHSFASGTLLEIADARTDERFHDNPLVTGDPHIRFYAGTPLITPDGLTIGTLCVIDRAPRELSAEQRAALAALGRSVMRSLESRRVSQLLEQQRRQHDLIVASVADGLHGLSLEGVIMLQNPAARRMLGSQADELIGRPAHETIHHHHADETVFAKADCPIYATLRDGVTRVVVDDVFWRVDGSSFPVEYAVSALTDETGIRVGAIVAFRDITARQAVERMKQEFVSTVSHELRTPLTAIRAALGLTLGGALGEIPPKARSILEVASRNSEHLTVIINDILDLEKIEAGTLAFDIRDADLAQLVHRAIEANSAYAARAGVTLVLHATPDRVVVEADEYRFAQVMANLLSNAVKYSPEGGTVEVSLRLADDAATVFVRDHGTGVPDEFRDRIFGRFAQADASDARAKSGSGLGLSITRAIVARMRGTVGFANHPGGGAEFFVRLPRHGTPARAVERPD